MALSAAQRVEVAFYAGYAAAGVLPTDVATVLDALTTEGEARLTARFLPWLRAMEDGLAASVDGMDTKQAAVWIRNENELLERSASYYAQRLALCRFLGLAPGPSLTVVESIPPFTTCCPRSGSTTTPGGETPGAELFTPAVFVVGIAALLFSPLLCMDLALRVV